MLYKSRFYAPAFLSKQNIKFSSATEFVLFDFLRHPSSAERARRILCGLEIKYFLDPYFGVIRGTTRASFYDSLHSLYRRRLIVF
ncbi:MAG: hypothetical protein ACRC9L_09815 [Brevinema sp.]